MKPRETGGGVGDVKWKLKGNFKHNSLTFLRFTVRDIVAAVHTGKAVLKAEKYERIIVYASIHHFPVVHYLLASNYLSQHLELLLKVSLNTLPAHCFSSAHGGACATLFKRQSGLTKVYSRNMSMSRTIITLLRQALEES